MNRLQMLIGIESADDTIREELDDSVDQRMTEVAVADVEVATAIETGQQLMDDTAALEQVEVVANEGAATGGLKGQTLAVVMHTTTMLGSRWGVTPTVVACESANADLSQTQIACEGIKDALYSVWERFLEWYRWLREKVKDAVLKLVNAGKSLRKQAVKIEERLDKGLGALKDNKSKIKGKFLTSGSYDGKFNLTQCLAVAENAKSDGKTLAAALAAITADSVKIIKDNDDKLDGGGEGKVDKAIKDLGVKSKKKLKGVIPKKATDINAKALPSNAYLVTWKDEQGSEETRFVTTGEDSDTKDIAPADESQIADMATAIDQIGEALELQLKNFASLDREETSLEKVLKDKLKELKSAKTEERAAIRDAKNEAQRNLRKSTAVRSAFEFTLRHAGAAIYGYAATSLSAYEKQ